MENKTALRNIAHLFSQNYLIVGSVLLLLIGTFVHSGFLSSTNLASFLTFTSIYGLVAISQAILRLVDDINLAIGSEMAVCPIIGVTVADLIGDSLGMNIVSGSTRLVSGWLLICVISMVVSVVLNLLIGLIRVKTGINSFILTLGLMYFFDGLGTLLIPYDIQVRDKASDWLGVTNVGSSFIPNCFVVFLAMGLIIVFLMAKTTFGKRIYAIGNNEKAAIYSGINSDKWRLIAFAVSGVFLGVASLVMVSRLRAVATSNGNNMMFYAIVISILAGIGSNRGSLDKVMWGACCFYLFINIMKIGGLMSWYQNIVLGVIPIAALIIQKLSDRRFAAKYVR